MLCGHSHGNDSALHIDAKGYGKLLETSFEVITAPKNLLEIAEIMDRKPLASELNPISPDDDQLAQKYPNRSFNPTLAP